MKKRIFFALNIGLEMYLVSQTRAFLTQKHIDYDLDYYHLHLETYDYFSKKETKYSKELIEYLKNHKKNITLNQFFKFLDSAPKYDLYCLPMWDIFKDHQLEIIKYLKHKYVDVNILAGGAHVILSPEFRSTLDDMGVEYTFLPVDAAVFNKLTNTNTDNFFLRCKTDQDIPIYTQKEIQDNNGKIYIQTSRGCRHHCFFCDTTGIHKKLDVVDRKVLAKWIKYYESQGVTTIHFQDAMINHDFDVLLDGLIENKNMVRFGGNHHTENTFMSFCDLTIEQASKLYTAGFDKINIDMSCINETLRKKYNRHKNHTFEYLLSILEAINNILDISIGYVYNLPHQTEEIFTDELQKIKYVVENYDVDINYRRFFYSPLSEAWAHRELFPVRTPSGENDTADDRITRLLKIHIPKRVRDVNLEITGHDIGTFKIAKLNKLIEVKNYESA